MRTFLADFDHQQRFGRNPPIIQLGLIHGSLWCYQVSSEAGSFAVIACAGSLRQAEEIVKECYPGSTVGIAFPIEPEHFFVERSHYGRYTGLVVTEELGELREVVVARA